MRFFQFRIATMLGVTAVVAAAASGFAQGAFPGMIVALLVALFVLVACLSVWSQMRGEERVGGEALKLTIFVYLLICLAALGSCTQMTIRP